MYQAGLILEGGGMRGVYTAGVLDCFLDNGIDFSHIYGVSAGACHACSYLSRQRGRAVRTIVDYVRDPRYAGVRSLLLTGDFFGVQMIYDEIPNRLLPYDYDAFAQSPTQFYAVMTNCYSGKAEYLPIKNLRRDMVRIQASSSLPVLSRIVEVDGRPYLDGGVSDSIPLARSIADGVLRNVVILTQHRGYQKKPNSMMAAIRLRYRKYPNLVESIRLRHQRYNAALELCRREEAGGRAFVIQPKNPVTIDRLERDADKLRALYQNGYDDARERLAECRGFLEQCKTGSSLS